MIYFIQPDCGGPIKIGHSVNVAKRLNQLQGAHYEKLDVLLCMPGRKDLESKLHERFNALRLRGEWFSPGDDLLAFIAASKQEQESDGGKWPVAICHLETCDDCHLWIVDTCPICGGRHTHGGGTPDKDPTRLLGHRVAHCLDDKGMGGYILKESR